MTGRGKPAESLGDCGDGDLADLIDRLSMLCERRSVSVATVREELGERSFGPLILVPAAIEISPIGAIPGLPTLLAAIIVIVAAQALVGCRYVWLPDIIEHRRVNGRRLAAALARMRPFADRLDRFICPRQHWLTRWPFTRLIALLCILLVLVVPVLEIVPFASSLPMLGVLLFGIAIFTRDGLVAAGGFLFSLPAVLGIYGLVLTLLA